MQTLHKHGEHRPPYSVRLRHIRYVMLFIEIATINRKRQNGLLAVSGLLNGIFGDGPTLHIARWQSVKVTDTVEESDDAGVTTIREKERFSHELRVVFRDGRVAVLK